MHTQTDDTLVVVRKLDLDFSDDFDAYVTISRFCFDDVSAHLDKGKKLKTVVDLPGFLSEVVFISNAVDGM